MSGKTEIRALLAIITNAAEAAMAEYDKTGHQIPSLRSADGHPLDDAGDTVSLKKTIRLLEASTALYNQVSSWRCSDANQGACDQLCATLAPPHHTMINVSFQPSINLLLLIIPRSAPKTMNGPAYRLCCRLKLLMRWAHILKAFMSISYRKQ
jgi:hypothetical protein